jgi:hypothetical protein
VAVGVKWGCLMHGVEMNQLKEGAGNSKVMEGLLAWNVGCGDRTYVSKHSPPTLQKLERQASPPNNQ